MLALSCGKAFVVVRKSLKGLYYQVGSCEAIIIRENPWICPF